MGRYLVDVYDIPNIYFNRRLTSRKKRRFTKKYNLVSRAWRLNKYRERMKKGPKSFKLPMVKNTAGLVKYRVRRKFMRKMLTRAFFSKQRLKTIYEE